MNIWFSTKKQEKKAKQKIIKLEQLINLIDDKAGDGKSPVAFLYCHPIFVSLLYIKCHKCTFRNLSWIPKFLAANKFAVGSLNAMTGTSVSFLSVRIFTQQLLKKAKLKQPTPNWVETHWYLSLHLETPQRIYLQLWSYPSSFDGNEMIKYTM